MKNVNEKKKGSSLKDHVNDVTETTVSEVQHIFCLDTLETFKEYMGCFGVLIFLPFWPILIIWRILCFILSIII